MSTGDIDFGAGKVGKVFTQLLFPTLVGMISIVVLNITDGAFIGHGVGGEGLAAINIAAPIFNIMSGISLMFGAGCSVVAAIQMSRGEQEEADRSMTRCLVTGTAVSIFLAILILCNLDTTCRLFGSNDTLLPSATAYLRWIVTFMPLSTISMMGEFIIKLDGNPKYAMLCTLCGAIVNIVLDYLFIFPFKMGLSGAALATGISFSLSGLMTLIYILFFTRTLHLHKLGFSRSEIADGLRNMGRQISNGFSIFLGEFAISVSMIVGNFVFIKYLGEAGVAAYSIACYCMPVAFMLGNAIMQSSQPVISFAYGMSNIKRTREALDAALMAALAGGLLGTAILAFCTKTVTSIFITSTDPAFALCLKGLPLFASGFTFIILNITLIGYMQSMEQSRKAIIFTLIRGYIVIVPAFILLPRILSTTGLWLALPVTEALTTLIIALSFCSKRLEVGLK